MFEDTTNFDFDDNGLETSFTPSTSSTQTCPAQKRQSEELVKENLKKLKPSDEQSVVSRLCNFDSQASKKGVDISFTSFQSPNKVVKRKFPGPAGLLPERTASNKSISELIGDKSDDTQDEMVLCSQRTVSVFEDEPWRDMTRDFHIPHGESLYEKFNISWIKKQTSLKKLLVNHKAPFLAAVIQNLEIFEGRVATINVTLKDATGEIQGSILHSLYEQYSSFFTVGSVLVIKQFGVLSAGYNNHCLTITPNNLVTIYSLQVPKKPPNDSSGQGFGDSGNSSLKKIVIQECDAEEIMRKYNEDVLASEQKQGNINFGRLFQNHSNLFRTKSNTGLESCTTSSCTESLLVNDVAKNNLGVLKLEDTFNRTNDEINRSPKVLSETKVSSSGNSSKKKFNFKQSGCLDRSSFGGTSSLVKDDVIDCGVVTPSSQLSIKSSSKEHTEIWRNLLQDVDADSLFDDF